MPHSYMTCLIHMWHASFIYDMTRTCVKSLIYLWHDLIHVTWLIHKYIPTNFFINHTHPRTHNHTTDKKNWHRTTTHSFSSVPIDTSARLPAFTFCCGADMGGTLLKETCTGHSYPKSAALCVASRWGAFKCVAVCCSVVSCVARRDLISNAHDCPSNKTYTSSKRTCMSPHMRPKCYQKSPTPRLFLFAIKSWWHIGTIWLSPSNKAYTSSKDTRMSPHMRSTHPHVHTAPERDVQWTSYQKNPTIHRKRPIFCTCDMTHSFFWRDAFMCDMAIHSHDMALSHVTWLIHYRTHSGVTWLIHVWLDCFMRDMTHSCVTRPIYMQRDSFTSDMTHPCVTWLIHVWYDAFVCDMTHSCVTRLIHSWHASFMCDIPHLCQLRCQ